MTHPARGRASASGTQAPSPWLPSRGRAAPRAEKPTEKNSHWMFIQIQHGRFRVNVTVGPGPRRRLRHWAPAGPAGLTGRLRLRQPQAAPGPGARARGPGCCARRRRPPSLAGPGRHPGVLLRLMVLGCQLEVDSGSARPGGPACQSRPGPPGPPGPCRPTGRDRRAGPGRPAARLPAGARALPQRRARGVALRSPRFRPAARPALRRTGMRLPLPRPPGQARPRRGAEAAMIRHATMMTMNIPVYSLE